MSKKIFKAVTLSSFVAAGANIHASSGTGTGTVQSSVASVGYSTAESMESSYSEERSLNDQDKAETDAKLSKELPNDEAILAKAAKITESDFEALRERRRSQEVNHNEALVQSINKEIYFLNKVKERAAIILSERETEKVE